MNLRGISPGSCCPLGSFLGGNYPGSVVQRVIVLIHIFKLFLDLKPIIGSVTVGVVFFCKVKFVECAHCVRVFACVSLSLFLSLFPLFDIELNVSQTIEDLG